MKKLLFFIFISTFYNLFPAGVSGTSTPELLNIKVRDQGTGQLSLININRTSKIRDLKTTLIETYNEALKKLQNSITVLQKMAEHELGTLKILADPSTKIRASNPNTGVIIDVEDDDSIEKYAREFEFSVWH